MKPTRNPRPAFEAVDAAFHAEVLGIFRDLGGALLEVEVAAERGESSRRLPLTGGRRDFDALVAMRGDTTHWAALAELVARLGLGGSLWEALEQIVTALTGPPFHGVTVSDRPPGQAAGLVPDGWCRPTGERLWVRIESRDESIDRAWRAHGAVYRRGVGELRRKLLDAAHRAATDRNPPHGCDEAFSDTELRVLWAVAGCRAAQPIPERKIQRTSRWIRDVTHSAGIAERTVRRRLNELVEKGLVGRIGEKRAQFALLTAGEEALRSVQARVAKAAKLSDAGSG